MVYGVFHNVAIKHRCQLFSLEIISRQFHILNHPKSFPRISLLNVLILRPSKSTNDEDILNWCLATHKIQTCEEYLLHGVQDIIFISTPNCFRLGIIFIKSSFFEWNGRTTNVRTNQQLNEWNIFEVTRLGCVRMSQFLTGWMLFICLSVCWGWMCCSSPKQAVLLLCQVVQCEFHFTKFSLYFSSQNKFFLRVDRPS